MNEPTRAMRAVLACALAAAAGSGWAQAGSANPPADPTAQALPGAATGAVIDKTRPGTPASAAATGPRPAASAAASGATRGAASAAASGARR